MAGLNRNEIVRPARTRIYLGAKGTVAPTTPTMPMPTGWVDCGYSTEDSLSFETEPEFEKTRSAQSDYPTKTFKTSESGTISVDLQQWNGANFKAVYGGGVITKISAAGATPAVYKFTPPKFDDINETSACIEVNEGPKHYRFIFPVTMQMEGVQSELQKGSESILALRLDIQGNDESDAWYMLTDDPAFLVP